MRLILLLVTALISTNMKAQADTEISGSEIYSRTLSVLEHYGIPAEQDPPALPDVSKKQTYDGLKKLLPFLDPTQQFGRFTRIDPTQISPRINFYQDRDSRTVRDFQIELAKTEPETDTNAVSQRLSAAKQNPASAPLQGLKIALDPGHMGSEPWDSYTGKFVKDDSGNIVREGVLALQTAMLLEQELRGLGADVLITRRALLPTIPGAYYDQLNVRELGREALLENSLTHWFQALLKQGEAGSDDLFEAFDESPQANALLSEQLQRLNYFNDADLDARARLIREYSPDITLVIHYDTNDPPGNPTGVSHEGYDKTKAYVPGSFDPSEFASREDRKYFAQHLFNPKLWEASVRLGGSIVDHLSGNLKLPFDPRGGGSSLEVRPGVFARNLRLTRKLTDHVTSYVECLHYNDSTEFTTLQQASHPLDIGGVNYPYSDRVAQVAQALREGIVDFVATY